MVFSVIIGVTHVPETCTKQNCRIEYRLCNKYHNIYSLKQAFTTILCNSSFSIISILLRNVLPAVNVILVKACKDYRQATASRFGSGADP